MLPLNNELPLSMYEAKKIIECIGNGIWKKYMHVPMIAYFIGMS